MAEITDKKQEKRPDGAALRNWGIGLMLLALLSAVGYVMTPITYNEFSPEIDPNNVALKGLFGALSAGSFSLGLVLWFAGYLAYLISFLPGREDA